MRAWTTPSARADRDPDGLDLPGRVDEASEEQLAAIDTLQSAVWEITEMGALTDATRAQVEAMVD